MSSRKLSKVFLGHRAQPIRGVPHAYEAVGLSRLSPIRYVRRHEMVPKRWGLTWRWPEMDVVVVSPLPLNWIFHWWYEMWWSFKIGPMRSAPMCRACRHYQAHTGLDDIASTNFDGHDV